jgi:uncharacterized protein with PQ loop repeat
MMDAAFFANLGNIIFALASLPQLKVTYQNRKSLKDLSATSFIFYSVATLCFLTVSLLIGAYAAAVIQTSLICYNVLTIYWILRSKKPVNAQ